MLKPIGTYNNSLFCIFSVAKKNCMLNTKLPSSRVIPAGESFGGDNRSARASDLLTGKSSNCPRSGCDRVDSILD